MTIAASLLPEFDYEMAGTRRVLERVPMAKGSWAPHERSMPMGRLATHIAELPDWFVKVLTTDELHLMPPGSPPYKGQVLDSTEAVLALFDKNVAEARRAIAATDDAAFGAPWTFKARGQVVFTRPRRDVYSTTVLNHILHHRGQLTVYLRLNEVPVPGLYGPSADER
jgi:uncharacterized damage-inducible protein DinB